MSHMPTGFSDFDRLTVLTELRTTVIKESTNVISQWLEDKINNIPFARDMSKLDGAVLKFAAKLNEPEVCQSCGQEVKRGETHP